MILFVDDDPSFLDSLRRLLHGQEKNWEMVFAQDPLSALEGARSNDFDVIITDAKMPGMSGFDLAAALSEDRRTRDVPIIFLTGSGETDLKRRALDIGATDLLNKPADLEELIARIRSALRLKAYQDEIRSKNEELDAKVRERTHALEESQVDVLWRLARVAEFHDEETGDHILRVGMYGRIIALALGLPNDFADQVLITAPLHDIGKIAIPDSILLKQGRLTDEERRAMQRHCAIGAEMLRQDFAGDGTFRRWIDEFPRAHTDYRNPLLTMAADIAMTHHERWDGSGYPMGLKGKEIPMESRIAGLADVFDALTSHRPYRHASSPGEALEIVRGEREKHDPDVFKAFEEKHDEILRFREEVAEESSVRMEAVQR
jgi:putative two-component system response regulator